MLRSERRNRDVARQKDGEARVRGTVGSMSSLVLCKSLHAR